jgi:hypothetical protein
MTDDRRKVSHATNEPKYPGASREISEINIYEDIQVVKCKMSQKKWTLKKARQRAVDRERVVCAVNVIDT